MIAVAHEADLDEQRGVLELDVPISGIQLSDQFHREAFDAAVRGRRRHRGWRPGAATRGGEGRMEHSSIQLTADR
jgi:hypothetical protein